MNFNSGMDKNNFILYTKKELKQFGKNQIIELYLQQQDFISQFFDSQKQLEQRMKIVEETLNEPKKDF